ncbi:MAG TPA: hypothetical protein VI685_09325 [Candidatus Angelobacter sp.]
MIDRRQLLSGILTSAALAISGCRDNSQKTETHAADAAASQTPPPKQLNVIVHGLMAVCVLHNPPSQNEGIKLVIPDIPNDSLHSPGHVYRAGNLQRTLPRDAMLIPFDTPGKYQILGLKNGERPDFSTQPENLYFPNTDNSLSVNESNQRVFVMPWPKKGGFLSIRPMFLGPVNSVTCDSASPLLATPPNDQDNAKLTSIASIHVFTYDCDPADVKGPRILTPSQNDFGWIPSFSLTPPKCTTIPTANLHIFAEPLKGVTTASHSIAAFSTLMSIIKRGTSTLDSGYAFNLFNVTSVRICPVSAATCYPGIDPNLDFINLVALHPGSAGQMANCVKALVEIQ